MNVEQTAQAVLNILVPALPYLIKGIKIVGKKAAEKLGESSGEALIMKASKIWDAIKAKSQKSKKLEKVAELLAEDNKDENAKIMFHKGLVDLLKKYPSLKKELFEILGGDNTIQEIKAISGGKIKDVDMKIKGHGKQYVKASGKGTIENVKQRIEN